MHAGRHHGHAGLQAGGDHGFVAVGRGDLHRLRRTVMVDLSSTQTEVALPSWRKALVGSLMTGTTTMPVPAARRAVAPSGG
jgi:hypothetical protein